MTNHETDQELFYKEAFQRNAGILNHSQQEKIRNATVAIAGLGGVGGFHTETLARTGFTKFHIADFDTFDIVNFNRQESATMETIGRKKVDVVRDLIHSINPHASVTCFEEGVTVSNIDDFLKGVDVVLDGLDFFALDIRRVLFRNAYQKGIYVVTAAPVGYGAAVMTFPPVGTTFDSYMDLNDSLDEQDRQLHFGLGLTPSLLQASYYKPETINWKKGKHLAPSLGVGVLLAANLAVTETIKIVIDELEKVTFIPSSLHFDPYVRKVKKVWVPFGNKNPIQKCKFMIAKFLIKRKKDYNCL